MDSTHQCDHQLFFKNGYTTEQLCSLSRDGTCELNYELFNFFAFTYCQINGAWGYTIPLAIIMLILIFRYLYKITSDLYRQWLKIILYQL